MFCIIARLGICEFCGSIRPPLWHFEHIARSPRRFTLCAIRHLDGFSLPVDCNVRTDHIAGT